MPDDDEIEALYPPTYWVGAGNRPRGGALATARERYRRIVLRSHRRFVQPVIDRQMREGCWAGLLDVGCGDGSTLESFASRPCTGLDNSLQAARAVRTRGLGSVRGLLAPSPFRREAFSVVTMFHVLEHLPRPQLYLEAAREVLTKDGTLIVQVPNVDSWQARILRNRWQGFDPPRHLVNFSMRTLGATLERAGFRVVDESQFSIRDNPAFLAMSLAPGLYPPARGCGPEPGPGEAVAEVAFFLLTLLSMPFAMAESLAGRGGVVMVQCRPV
jgi:SAM-dependent methyltransferase